MREDECSESGRIFHRPQQKHSTAAAAAAAAAAAEQGGLDICQLTEQTARDVSLFLPAAQPTGQGKESVVLVVVVVVVGVTTFHTTVY